MSIYHVLVQHVKDTKKCISLLVFLNIVSICSIQNRFKSYLVFHYFVSKSTFKQKLNDLFLILVSNILFHLKKKKKNSYTGCSPKNGTQVNGYKTVAI